MKNGLFFLLFLNDATCVGPDYLDQNVLDYMSHFDKKGIATQFFFK